MTAPQDDQPSTSAASIHDLFKAYDVRGLVPGELNPDLAYRIGRALVATLHPSEVAVGRDMRVSSPAIAGSLIDGIVSMGANVVDLGEVSTDGLYFAVGKFGYAAGVMVTASHNPGEYNGIKFCREEARPISLDSELALIRDATIGGVPSPPADQELGHVQGRDILADYADHMLSLVDAAAIKPLKVAIDAGNGMAGITVPAVFAHLPVTVVPLFFDLDGTFPNHEANPIEPKNTAELRRVVVEQGCDLGLAFDGDADRVFLIDGRGEFVGGDMVTALVALKLLQRSPGAAVVYNLICSRSTPEAIAAAGGRPLRSRVGHSYIKQLMRDEDAVFGGEHSGHFYFRDLWYADSGMLAALTVLELVSEAGQPVSQIIAPIDTRVRSGEINSEVADPEAIMAHVASHFERLGGEIDHLDGVTVNFPDWWFNLRASNTQPLLRLNVEVDRADDLQKRVDEVLALVRGGQA